MDEDDFDAFERKTSRRLRVFAGLHRALVVMVLAIVFLLLLVFDLVREYQIWNH